MTKLLLSVHVLAAILAIGPIAVAASLFPRYARQPGATGATALLHRICGGYAVAAVTVPVFGFATALHMGVLGDAWLVASIVLTALAAAVLGLSVVPGQRRVMAALDGDGGLGDTAAANGRLAMATGLFNLLWAAVVVLMIVRPGSTTGA